MIIHGSTRKGTFGGTGASTNQVVNRGGVYSFSATGVPEIATPRTMPAGPFIS